MGITKDSLSSGSGPFLHAAISCKWTIRSDRVQNIRHEFLQLIKHRRGRLPHLVTVTAEPMPSRIASIAQGTGEVDAVYHIAFDALREAVDAVGSKQQKNYLAELIGQGRLRPYEELASTLTTW
ncbi:NgoMIV family type II restriction endonuclease [Streptomyces sp. NPDC002545]